jgi:hypothetical protein
MKVKFFCNSGANIHSTREDTFDTVKDLVLDEGEWESMSDEDKYKMAEEWANERLEIGYYDA